MNRDIAATVKNLTLEEKAALCSGADQWHLNGVPRLGIPSVMVSDGPHGLRKKEGFCSYLEQGTPIPSVCYPAACATAASFDRDLLFNLGETLGEECIALDISVLLGPGVNIKRSPLCGRNFEYFSEDPLLSGDLATAYIKGVQSKNIGASLKHFACNNQETRRMVINAVIDERTLREIYLVPHEIAVKESKPWTVMCCYNRVNGVYGSEHKKLLTDILRNEWGFSGYVISDWSATDDRAKGLDAGLDLEMPASMGVMQSEIVKAVQNGTLAESVLDTSCARILDAIFRYIDNRPTASIRIDNEVRHEKAVRIAEESAVLLKNDGGVLPLNKNVKILFVGEFAEKPRFQGGGSSHIDVYRVSSALEEAKKTGLQVQYERGFFSDNDIRDETLFNAALDAARQAEITVIFAGLPESWEFEGGDRKHMKMPSCQNDLIQAISSISKNTVVVLHNGSPVEMPWAAEVPAILEMYLGGEGVGLAALRLLTGESNPSGKLAETFPLHLEDNPSYLNFPGDDENVHYAEGVYVGYRYYDKKKSAVLFPFGHGLSYTDFSYSNLVFDALKINAGEMLNFKVDVTNTGKREGKEIIQVYVSDISAEQSELINRPEKELKEFAKVCLDAGETKTVFFSLPPRAFQWWSTKINDWYCSGGIFEILIGASSRNIRLRGKIEIVQKELLPFDINRNTLFRDIGSDPRTSETLRKLIAEYCGKYNREHGDDILSPERFMSMMLNKTPRFMRSSYGVTEEEVILLVEELRKAVNTNVR
jgi:beta-glucosidase